MFDMKELKLTIFNLEDFILFILSKWIHISDVFLKVY